MEIKETQFEKDIKKGQKTLDDKVAERLSSGVDVQEWTDNLSSEIDYIIPIDCVAKDIQTWILEGSRYPQPALAYAAAMSVVACCIGRNLCIDGIKGNLMFVGLAESGEGKDYPFKMAKSILKAVDMAGRIEGKPASGAAFIEALEEKPSMMLHIDEFGKFIEACSGKKASIYATEIITMITEAYTSASDEIRGKRTKGFDAKVVQQPNVCLFGLATEGQVFNSLSTSDVADGSIARYSIYFGEKGLLPKRIKRGSREVPQKIIDGLNGLIDEFNGAGAFFDAKNIEPTDLYDDVMFELSTKAKAKSNKMAASGTEKAYFTSFYNRVFVRALQCALITDQCIDEDLLEWFFNVEMKSTDIFVKKFMHLGADNENERLVKLIQAKIKEAGKKGISAKSLIAKTRQAPSYIRKQLLEEMIESDTIKFESVKVGDSHKLTTFYYWLR